MTNRYRADPTAIAAMKHDGIGWDHDLRGGRIQGLDAQPLGPLERLTKRLKGHRNGTS